MSEKIKVNNITYGPFATVIVGANVEDKPNYTTIGAYGVVCEKPILYVSLKNTHYSTKGVKETGFFSVNIPNINEVEKTDLCGIISGNENDKSKIFTSFYDDNGNAPMIKECSVNYLCKVIKEIPVEDFTMFLGELVSTYASDDCITDGKLDSEKVKPINMMYPSYFGMGKKIGDIFQAGRELEKEYKK